MSPDSPRSRDRNLRHAAQRIAAIGRCRRARLPRRPAERRVRRAGAPSTTRSARAGRRLGPSPPARRRPPHDRLRQPVEPHRLPAERSAATAGGTGTDVRGDRPGRSPRSPSSGTGSAPAASCCHGRRAMAAAPSAPARAGSPLSDPHAAPRADAHHPPDTSQRRPPVPLNSP